MTTAVPSNAGELYDLLQVMFGLGDYDEHGDIPWYRARMLEISKLKGMLTKRKATPQQVAVAAHYARDQGLAISAAWQLFELIPEAMVAARRAAQEAAPSELQQAIDEAVKLGLNQWAERLIRVDKADASAVLKEWRNRHV